MCLMDLPIDWLTTFMHIASYRALLLPGSFLSANCNFLLVLVLEEVVVIVVVVVVPSHAEQGHVDQDKAYR
jgi:hypothetical protein